MTSPYEPLPEEIVAAVALVMEAESRDHPARLAALRFAVVAVATPMRDLGVDRRRVRRALLEAAQAVRIDPEAATVATLPLVVGE